MVKLLVEHNADINAFGYQNNTPLHEATLNKKRECVKYLIERGADLTLRNAFGILAKDFVKNCKDYQKIFDHETNACQNSQQQQANVPTQADLPMSSFAKKYQPKNKKILLFGTGMDEAAKSRLAQLASKLNLQVSKEINKNGIYIYY